MIVYKKYILKKYIKKIYIVLNSRILQLFSFDIGRKSSHFGRLRKRFGVCTKSYEETPTC